MLSRRIIACLDVLDGRVVKGTQFRNLRDIGDPVELAFAYEAQGIDEVVFLDIAAGNENRSTLLDVVKRTAQVLFIPLTVGGGIRSVADMGMALRAGADKVSINSAAVSTPELLTDCARQFGSQCVVASVDASWDAQSQSWYVTVMGGRAKTSLDVIEWAAECEARGAGEILLTSVDRDGSRDGYDIRLTRAVKAVVNIPVVASGGAGSAQHVREVLLHASADAALVAGLLHDGIESVAGIKKLLQAAALPVRHV